MIDRLFKSLALKHPTTGQIDVMITLVVFAVVICAIKFVLNDVTITTAGHTINLGHTDAFSFGSFLTPILGAHGYMSANNPIPGDELLTNGTGKVDNPDERA